jgi:hypothetical protein
MFLEFFSLVPIQLTYFKPKKFGVTPDNRIPLNMYPLAGPNVRQITLLFTLYYKSDDTFVNSLVVSII